MHMSNVITPFERELRRGRAHNALADAIVAVADVDHLVEILSSTPAQSAADRRDDLCAVYVRGALSDDQVMEIEGRTEEERLVWRRGYGASVDAKRSWRHSWTCRRVSRNGEMAVLSRAAWMRENALAILRDGGVEVRVHGGEWVRVVPEADFRAVALAAAPAPIAA